MTRRTRIKFCGNTRVEDMQLAASLGVDFLGVVLVPGSPRAVTPLQAETLRQKLRAAGHATPLIALFQNADAAAVAEALAVFKADGLQWHGREPPAFCGAFGLPYFRAVPMGEPQDYAAWERDFASAQALLADSHTPVGGGGSGHGFRWADLPAVSARRLPLMLAGGLTPDTVAAAIRQVQPWAVDVSSGIEVAAKGVKDALKMRAFVAAVREADEAAD
jgi:phosphoribosylanthranilate isomerase